MGAKIFNFVFKFSQKRQNFDNFYDLIFRGGKCLSQP